MTLEQILAISISLIILSALLTGFIRRLSIKGRFIDIPNERSSHKTPIPKGGGVSIVLILNCTIMALFFYGKIELDLFISMLVGLFIVSLIGFIDDCKSLSILIRAFSYMLASIFSLYVIGGFLSVSINNYYFNLGSFGFVLGTIFMVWMTNLYNFMDGTDGLAGIQTICVSFFCGLLLYFSSHFYLGLILICLASATIGFLCWNWPPAKIFMGDVGSCAIGFLFGLLAIYTEKKGIVSISVWLILLAPFFGDATYTLLKRMINGEKWYKAHNSHAYQKLYQIGLSHRKLAVRLMVVNITVVWPLAYFAYSYKNIEFAMLLSAYCVIGMIWLAVQNKHQKIKMISS